MLYRDPSHNGDPPSSGREELKLEAQQGRPEDGIFCGKVLSFHAVDSVGAAGAGPSSWRGGSSPRKSGSSSGGRMLVNLQPLRIIKQTVGDMAGTGTDSSGGSVMDSGIPPPAFIEEASLQPRDSVDTVVTDADMLTERVLVMRREHCAELAYLPDPAPLHSEGTATSAGSLSSSTRYSSLGAAAGAGTGTIYCASEEWEQQQEENDLGFAQQYFPHLFSPPSSRSRARCGSGSGSGSGSDSGSDSGGEDDWALPMSQDF